MFLSWSAAHTGEARPRGSVVGERTARQAPQWAWAWRGAGRSGWAGLGWAGGRVQARPACRQGRLAPSC